MEKSYDYKVYSPSRLSDSQITPSAVGAWVELSGGTTLTVSETADNVSINATAGGSGIAAERRTNIFPNFWGLGFDVAADVSLVANKGVVATRIGVSAGGGADMFIKATYNAAGAGTYTLEAGIGEDIGYTGIWNPVTQAFLRIVEDEDGVTVLWQTSPDNATWSTVYSTIPSQSVHNHLVYHNLIITSYLNEGGAGGTLMDIILDIYNKSNITGYLGDLEDTVNVGDTLEFTVNANEIGSTTNVTLAVHPDDLDTDIVSKGNFVEIFMNNNTIVNTAYNTILQDENDENITDESDSDIEVAQTGIATSPMYDTKRVFCGYISRIERRYGSSPAVILSLLSHGTRMASIIPTYPSSPVNKLYNTTDNAYGINARQEFTVNTTFTANRLSVKVSNQFVPVVSSIVTIFDQNGNILVDGINIWSASISGETITIDLGDIITFTNGVKYTVLISGLLSVHYHSSNTLTPATGVVSSQQLYIWNGTDWVTQAGSATIVLISDTPTTKYTYSSVDPSEIASSVLSIAAQAGLAIVEGGLAESGYDVSFTFNLNTVKDILESVAKLSPSDYMWYIDVGSNEYRLISAAGTNHILALGVHLTDVSIISSIEELYNAIYYTGGDTGGGTNLLVFRDDEDSIDTYGQYTKALSDGRVTVEDTADIIATGEIDKLKNPTNGTVITISAATYNIESFSLGDTVQIVNSESINDVIGTLQIVGITYRPASVSLTLGVQKYSMNKALEAIRLQQSIEANKDT